MMKILLIVSCLAVIQTQSIQRRNNVIIQYLGNGQIRCRTNCRAANPLNDCPPVDCPPVRDQMCGAPDCSIAANRLHLHPHRDPNYYYQCAPIMDGIIARIGAVQMPCACGTVFSANFDPTRCVHPHEFIPDCPAHQGELILSEEQCVTECPNCEDGNTPIVGTPVPPTNGPGNNCPCPCVCMWWPCAPCQSNCACSG